jgi:hypothetical protein
MHFGEPIFIMFLLKFLFIFCGFFGFHRVPDEKLVWKSLGCENKFWIFGRQNRDLQIFFFLKKI